MEAYIRLFNDHCTAMVADVDSHAVVLQRSFGYTPGSTTADAYEWLAKRGFNREQIAEYDWSAVQN